MDPSTGALKLLRNNIFFFRQSLSPGERIRYYKNDTCQSSRGRKTTVSNTGLYVSHTNCDNIVKLRMFYPLNLLSLCEFTIHANTRLQWPKSCVPRQNLWDRGGCGYSVPRTGPASVHIRRTINTGTVKCITEVQVGENCVIPEVCQLVTC